MTKLTNYVVLSAVLSILSTAGLMPSALAQGADSATTTTTTTAPAKAAAPHKTTARKRTAKKRVKIKAAAAKDIEKGVQQAGTNLKK
jgi:hypothetical protein